MPIEDEVSGLLQLVLLDFEDKPLWNIKNHSSQNTVPHFHQHCCKNVSSHIILKHFKPLGWEHLAQIWII
jgi:hypothetical protein